MIKPRTLLRLVFLGALLAWLPGVASAQDTGAATGTVHDREGQPIAGIKVTIQGTRRSTKTAKDGTFRIDRIQAGEVIVRFDGDGYVGVIEKLMIDAGWTTGVDIEMTPMVAMLDALVVEAGLGKLEGEAVSHSATVHGDDSDGDAFSKIARVPGVQVMRPNGSLGAGASILMRGISSITLSNAPVIYVDGIRVSGGQQVYGQQARGAGSQEAFNLDFMDPKDIDRIEVLRGPATAVRYGLDAATGVILIYTKRGGRS